MDSFQKRLSPFFSLRAFDAKQDQWKLDIFPDAQGGKEMKKLENVPELSPSQIRQLGALHPCDGFTSD